MYIETTNEKFYLEFVYSQDEFNGTTTTESRIYEGDGLQSRRENLKYTFGKAFQNPADRFDREKGRQVALHRALDSGFFDKETRREIWKGYFARSPKNAHIVEAISKTCAAA